MLIIEFIIVLLAIFLGARLGSIGIGYAGGLGVLVLAVVGVKPGNIPFDVISIIMAVIVLLVDTTFENVVNFFYGLKK